MGNEPPPAGREIGPTTARPSFEANRSEIRAVFSARSWLDAIRRCLLVIAAIAGVTSIQGGGFERTPSDSEVFVAVTSLVVLGTSLALYLLVRRQPVAGLRAVWVACALAVLVSTIVSEPSVRHEWRALERGAESWFFAGSVGVFIVLPYLVARFSRGVTALGVGSAVAVIALLTAIGGWIDPRFIAPFAFTILLLAVTMALRQVEASWKSIGLHPEWFAPPGPRSRRDDESRIGRDEIRKTPRGPTGIARTYLRWQRLNRPAIRTGGTGALGLK